MASQRNQTNKISKLRNDGGMVFYDEENIEKGFTFHFKETSKSSDPKNINELAELVKGSLDDEMREIMNKDLTKEEVKEALFQMHPLKALRPDSTPGPFYQKFWRIVGDDVKKWH